MLKTQMLDLLNEAIKRFISCDPEHEKILKPLVDKTLSLTVSPPGFQFYITGQAHGFILSLEPLDEIDASITGSIQDLFKTSLAAISKDNAKIRSAKLDFSGDIFVAQAFTDVFQRLEIDLSDPLSDLIGETPAHFVSEGLKQAKDFFGTVASTITQNGFEYATEELKVSPPAVAFDVFAEGVSMLSMDVDRLEARVKKLQSQLGEQ